MNDSRQIKLNSSCTTRFTDDESNKIAPVKIATIDEEVV